jgi:hypothetical protein
MQLRPADLQTIYRDLYRSARTDHPELPAAPPELVIDPKARTTKRSFAYFQFPAGGRQKRGTRDRSKCRTVAAPSMALNEARATAVLAHEIGHAVDHFVRRRDLRDRLRDVERPDGRGTVGEAGLPSSPERLADLIAESILGCPLGYDSSEVQTTDEDAFVWRPRPKRLG